MDDFHIVAKTTEELEAVRDRISENLKKSGLWLHSEKTMISNAKDGVLFLGYLFKVTESGKVLMLRDPKRVKANRRKLRRLANKVIKGDRSLDDFEKSYECIRACMDKGNSAKLMRRMDSYTNKLKEEINAVLQ